MKFYFLIMIFVSNFANSVNWICKAPNPMDELISAPKARVINTDEFFTTENYTFRPGEERKYSEGKAITKDLEFCRTPKDSFFVKKSSEFFFIESRCSGGISKYKEVKFSDDLIFERFEWFFEKTDLRDLDWDSDNIYLMEDKYQYQIEFQEFNSTNIVKHPLIIVKPNELKLEIRDLPENELSPRYSTDCTRP